jgi:hypothetical protein
VADQVEVCFDRGAHLFVAEEISDSRPARAIREAPPDGL